MAFLSNLIQDRFLLEALGTVRRLPPTASEVWRAIEPFRGKWQYRRLEFFERVLGLEGRDAGATKKHLQTIRRALASLNAEGLVELWGSTGRGRETIFRFWIAKRPALTPAQ
jgi:hypothetical protein